MWLQIVVSDTTFKMEPSPWRAGPCFGFCAPHSWCSEESLSGLKLFSPPPPPSFSIPALSLPSITPDCIWQMPLLAPYHQVQWRQPKTILLCPYTTSVLHFAWMTHLLLQGLNRAKTVSGKAPRVAASIGKGRSWSWIGADTASAVTADTHFHEKAFFNVLRQQLVITVFGTV